MHCIFCRILAGEAEASLLYRDDRCAAFMDVQPVTPGHLLVIPIAHAVGLADLDPATGGHIFQVGQRLAAALKASGLPCNGIDLFLADGAEAGQTVFHAHLHVIPRVKGDGFGFRFPPGYPQHPPRATLDVQAESIRCGL
ncbi:MAG: HIT family protein [Gammaproteobacteria bacterium]|nr:HIT family protein [Gammaproteobacteria bacterium]MBI5615561.1 HIT family protein [Gammaproteobacteria bacterium]